MDGSTLQEIAMRTAAGLPAVTHTFPFGPEHDVFKVAGTVFLMATEAPGEQIVTLKCEPPHGSALRQEFATITPGYHINKTHWLSVAAGPGITEQLVAELVLSAYALVLEGLPAPRRRLVTGATGG
ncbi:MAG TPA: MmcQ/YjbR family DNA-binding protein [Kocuria rosea]|jgi:predicted DNA-binding protein (MmcQ/YjbR family)|nr:MmcQ/YjbR family DNA-binding protein [Kocuria rosea]